MPTWLGQTPAGNGWRYMHDDGRVEDVDHTALGLPPDWAPPGFAPDPGQTSYVDASGQQPIPADVAEAVVTPTNQPLPSEQAAPAAAAQPALGTSSSRGGSVSASYTGPGLPMDFQPSGKLAQRAAREAKQQVQAFAPAVQAQKNAVMGMADAQAAGSDAQAAGLVDEAELQRRQAEERARQVADINTKAQGYTDQIKEAINSVPTMDVKRIFKNQSNLESASMGIAAFMAGFSGNKQPMDIINRAVDQDIAEQQNAQEMAQKKVWNLKDLAKLDMDQAMWDLNQKDTARLTALNALKLDVAAKVQGYQSEVFRKSGEKMLADLDKGMADTFQNIYTNTRDFLHKQWVDAQAAARASQSLRIQQQEADARRAAAGAPSRAELEKRAIRDPATNKVVGYLATGTDAQAGEYNTKQAAAFNTSRNLLKLNKLVHENGPLWKKSNWGSTEKAQELRGVYNDLLADIIKSKTGAAATETEIQRLEKVLPFPSKINPDTFRNIENYVDKVVDEQNATNSASLAPLEGEQALSYNFADSVKRLRAEYSTSDPAVPIKSMHEGMLMLDAAGEDPTKVQTTVRKILAAAEGSSSVDTGRRDIEAAIERLSKLPVEVRSLPSVDGDIDPVRKLESMLISGRQVEINKEDAAAAEAARAANPMGYEGVSGLR